MWLFLGHSPLRLYHLIAQSTELDTVIRSRKKDILAIEFVSLSSNLSQTNCLVECNRDPASFATMLLSRVLGNPWCNNVRGHLTPGDYQTMSSVISAQEPKTSLRKSV